MNNEQLPAYKRLPDAKGFFGKFGGSFVPEALQKQMNEITRAYHTI